MIKVKDIAEKYGEYGIDEDKLKEILIDPQPKTVWDLKKGDEYCLFGCYGDVTTCIWSADSYDINARNMNNAFLTRAEAEFEVERRKVEAEMLKYGGTRDMMSLGDAEENKFIIAYDNGNAREIVVDLFHTLNYQGSIYFKTAKDARDAIDKIGEDRIKKYIFNV